MKAINIIYYLLRLSILLAIIFHYGEGQQNEVSPKLDFDEAEEQNNGTNPITVAKKQGKSDEIDIEREKESDGEKKGKSGPKIHGVRVTVDTGDTRHSKESKESVEVTDFGKNKKRVGIHTDITFEITAGELDHANKTSREEDIDKEDASVPIFKGRGGTVQKNHKSHDPRTHWNPNFSSERRNDPTGRGAYPNNYYPEYYPNNVPVYVGTARAQDTDSGIYRQSDGWVSYIPRWTTERSVYVEAYNKPADISAYKHSAWKPCYCLSNSKEYRKRRDNTPHYHYQPHIVAGTLIEVLDDKLQKPFSRK